MMDVQPFPVPDLINVPFFSRSTAEEARISALVKKTVN
jgi:hypothetical protein